MDIENTALNPIDIVEDVIHSKKWTFSRADDYELVAEIASQWCQYRLYFTWSEQIKAISFTVTFDLKFPQIKSSEAQELLALINEKLWIGHFDITSVNGIPAFRHTVLSLPEIDILHRQLEDLVDIGIYECEKYYPAFQLVLFEDIEPKKALIIAFSYPGNIFLFLFSPFSIAFKTFLKFPFSIFCNMIFSQFKRVWYVLERNKRIFPLHLPLFTTLTS